ncbi:MAG: hypothetical protein R3Y57_06705 [Erysipelotrichaceae bacterium]
MNDTIKLYAHKINVYEHELAKEDGRNKLNLNISPVILFVTFLQQGAPDRVLHKLVGHANAETTMNIHTHATKVS